MASSVNPPSILAKSVTSDKPTLSSSFKAQRFADVSDPINIGSLKSAFYSHLTETPFKQGPNPDRLSLCEEMCLDPIVFADIERICSVDNLKHVDGEEYLKSLNINNIETYQNVGDLAIFRQRSRRRETGSIWSKDSVNTVSKIAPLNNYTHITTIKPDDLILTVTIFHPVLKKKDQEFLVLASQTLNSLLDNSSHQYYFGLLDKIYCVMDYVAPEEFSEYPERLKELEGHTFKSASSFFLIEDIFYNDKSYSQAIDSSKPIIKWANSKVHGRPRNPYSSRYFTQDEVPVFMSKDMKNVRFEDLTIKLGYPYLFHHHGNCEHVFMIRDIRVVMEDDNPNENEYPLLTFKGKYRRRRCSICHVFTAKWLTCNDELAFEHPSYFCDKCYFALHYSNDNKKLCNFHSYPHVDKV